MTQVINIRGQSSNQELLKHVVYVGRECNRGGWNLSRSKWHNPYVVGTHGTLQEVLVKYYNYLTANKKLMEDLPQLKGRLLGCWCKTSNDGAITCHAQILANLADGQPVLLPGLSPLLPEEDEVL